MVRIRWQPARYTHDNFRKFNPLTQRVFRDDRSQNGFTEETTWRPALDLSEYENQYVLSAELPGLTKDNIHLSMDDHVLTIKGEKAAPQVNQNDNHFYRERDYGKFERRVHLNNDVDTGSIDASYDNGVLKITLPKTQESLRKEIPVNFKK